MMLLLVLLAICTGLSGVSQPHKDMALAVLALLGIVLFAIGALR